MTAPVSGVSAMRWDKTISIHTGKEPGCYFQSLKTRDFAKYIIFQLSTDTSPKASPTCFHSSWWRIWPTSIQYFKTHHLIQFQVISLLKKYILHNNQAERPCLHTLHILTLPIFTVFEVFSSLLADVCRKLCAALRPVLAYLTHLWRSLSEKTRLWPKSSLKLKFLLILLAGRICCFPFLTTSPRSVKAPWGSQLTKCCK